MMRAPSTSRLLAILLLLAGLASPAGADVLLPVYRHGEAEERFQEEGTLPHAPSPREEMMSVGRAMTAARNRDFDELAAAAGEIVVHARAGVAAGRRTAAEAWLTLYRYSHEFGEDWGHDWDERRAARRAARDALREAAYSLYAAYRSSSDPVFAGDALRDFSAVQTIREEHVSAEFALLAILEARPDPDARERLKRIRREHGFRILQARVDEDRDDPRACIALSTSVAKKQRENIADYVAIKPGRGDHPVVLRDSTLCLGNLEHGVEYTLALLDGLTDVHGRTVVPGERRVLVPDRPARRAVLRRTLRASHDSAAPAFL